MNTKTTTSPGFEAAPDDVFLRQQDVLKRLSISRDTLLDWESRGKITTVRTPGGHRRYRAADVDSLMSEAST